MAENLIQLFNNGVQNLVSPEIIKNDASQDELNWVAVDGKIKLIYGRKLLGGEGVFGKITGLIFGYKVDGSKVMYRKISTKIQYLRTYHAGETMAVSMTFPEGYSNSFVFPDTDITYTAESFGTLAGADTISRLVNGSWVSHIVGLPVGNFTIIKGDTIRVHRASGSTTISINRKFAEGEQEWTDVITGLTTNSEYSFANYSNNAGSFTFFSGIDGMWMVNNAFPTNKVQLWTSSDLYKGRILIDRGRMLLWNVKDNLTTLYGSRRDNQIAGTNYTAVSGEATTSLGGTLAYKAGGAKRFCFGVTITLTGTGEKYVDDFLGHLTGSLGGTGTINYETGVYTISNSGVGTASYGYIDATSKGVADFSSSSTRLASEGFTFPQDYGGDAILQVLIGQDGAYYSMKAQSTYKLIIPEDDLTGFTNEIYRSDLGIQNYRACFTSNKGIVFMNTANPDKPEMTILQKNLTSDNLEPVILFSHFKFANYDYSDCAFSTWERYIVVHCMKKGSVRNDTTLLCDINTGIVDITNYGARMSVKDAGNLYIGGSLTEDVYQIFTGFDDNGDLISNYWISKNDSYKKENLKKFRGFKIKGLIDPNQSFEIWMAFDGGSFQLMGTIKGDGSYVDYSAPQSIGVNMLGQSQIGGDDIVGNPAYPFFTKIPVKMPKFRTRTVKFIALGFGYLEINLMSDWDILLFEDRLPTRFRQKSHISLDGTQQDLPNAL